jgi:ribosomal protein S18
MILKIDDDNYEKFFNAINKNFNENFNAINENFNKVILILPIESIYNVFAQKQYINNIEIIKNYIESRGKILEYEEKEDLTEGINDYITWNVNFNKSNIYNFKGIICNNIINFNEYANLKKNIENNINKNEGYSKQKTHEYDNMMKYISYCESFIEKIYSITYLNEIEIREYINENIKINIFYK